MILDALRQPASAISYAALTALREHSPAAFILESPDSDFNWQGFRAAGLCRCAPKPDVLEQAAYGWSVHADQDYRAVVAGFFDVTWEGQSFGLLQVQFETACGTTNRVWVTGESEAAARGFFAAVCRWSTAVREGVVYVFQEGYWNTDAELFRSIQSSRLDGLILPPGLKETVRDDAAAFFNAKNRYARFNVPWKRGLMLLGPPGNGKTHMIKALINELGKPPLYVKSLKARHGNEDSSLRTVFDKARETAPCILVMEDVDALIDNENRSFFLNELDGFRKNDGLLVIATTNHPERLDPAIVDRPSRFDRKYHFDLPAVAERAAYLRWWNRQLDEALRLTESGVAGVAAATDGFSFAYLKELVLSSMMAWVNSGEAPMDETMPAQLVGLREQMNSSRLAPAVVVTAQ